MIIPDATGITSGPDVLEFECDFSRAGITCRMIIILICRIYCGYALCFKKQIRRMNYALLTVCLFFSRKIVSLIVTAVNGRTEQSERQKESKLLHYLYSSFKIRSSCVLFHGTKTPACQEAARCSIWGCSICAKKIVRVLKRQTNL